LPAQVKKDATQRVDFLPDLFTHEIFLTMFGLFITTLLVVFFYNAPLETHANPLRTPLDTMAPWYFLWLQGMLKLGDKTIMGIILPTIIFGVLFLVPYIDRNPNRRFFKRPIAVGIGLLSVMALAVLTYAGLPQFGIETPVATRIMQDLAPEEGVGPLRAIPYDELLPGTYVANETDPETLPPHLAELFTEYTLMVNEGVESGALPNAEALMIIEDWQTNLKKVALRINWDDPADQSPKTLTHEYYLHRDRPREH
jgi:hypothetical protein